MTKVTSTTTALVEEESDGDGILVEAEPHVKRKLNHLQARLGLSGTELQNATAAV